MKMKLSSGLFGLVLLVFTGTVFMSCDSGTIQRFFSGEMKTSLSTLNGSVACVTDDDCPPGMWCEYYDRVNREIKDSGSAINADKYYSYLTQVSSINQYMMVNKSGVCRSYSTEYCLDEAGGLCISPDADPCLDSDGNLSLDKAPCFWPVSGIPLSLDSVNWKEGKIYDEVKPDEQRDWFESNWFTDYGRMCGWMRRNSMAKKDQGMPGYYHPVGDPWRRLVPPIKPNDMGGMCIPNVAIADSLGVAATYLMSESITCANGSPAQVLSPELANLLQNPTPITELCNNLIDYQGYLIGVDPLSLDACTLSMYMNDGYVDAYQMNREDNRFEMSLGAVARICTYLNVELPDFRQSFVVAFRDKWDGNGLNTFSSENEAIRYYVYKLCVTDDDCRDISYSTGGAPHDPRSDYLPNGVFDLGDAMNLFYDPFRVYDMTYMAPFLSFGGQGPAELRCVKGMSLILHDEQDGDPYGVGAVSPWVKVNGRPVGICL